MEQTVEILELSRRVKENTETLLKKHYKDNEHKIRQAIAWKAKAQDDTLSRGALYQLISNYGDKDIGVEERVNIICESIELFSEIFGYVNSPKTKNKHLPLILFPFQKKLIREIVFSIENGSSLLIEKSREMGVSWTVIYVFTWYWLFKPGSNFLLGSYKEALVTDGTIDSMFGKVRYILDGLPKWVLPSGFNMKNHFNKKRIFNSALDNYITGDTMNSDFGRGARKTAIFFDELGFWDYGKAAWESSSETTDCRIGNSTPNGYNYFKYLLDSGLNKITLHWREHPLKDDLWYEYKKKTETPETVAQEIDISYEASRVGVIYSEWKDYVVKGVYEYDDSLPLYVSMDFGNADGVAIIWSQIKHGKLVILDALYKKNVRLIDFFVPFITGQMLTEYQYEYTEEEFEMIQRHSRWKKAVVFGDPAGNQKHQNQDYSVIETLRIYGINVNVNYEKNSHAARHSAAKRIIMRGIELNKNKDTLWLDTSMLNYSWSATTTEGIKIVKSNATPKHDQYSHMATAFEYLAVGLEGIKPTNEKRIFDKRISSVSRNRHSKRRIR